MAQEAQIAAETAHAAEAAGGLDMLGINLKIFIAQLVNFIVVLLVLWKWAYQPIVDRLEKRREVIEKGVKNAETAEMRLKEVATERKEVMQEAKQEASDILQQAREQAEERQQEMVAEAKQQVEQVVARGKDRLKADRQAMLEDMRGELAEIVVAASAKVLSESIDEERSREMALETIREMT